MLFVLLFLLYLVFPPQVTATDTCCVGHGGDYACDYSSGQLYCNDKTISTACTCQAAPTLTPTPLPTQVPVISQGPVCPANANFNANSNACTCISGYIVSSNACVTYSQYCQAQYGNTSYYNSTSNSCACSSGYVWNTAGTSCVTMDGLCNEKIGSKSYYNSSNNSCYCYEGYAMQNGQCQIVPTPVPPATISPTTGVPIVPPTPIVLPTLAGVIVPTHAPTLTKGQIKKVPEVFNYKKKVPGLIGFVSVKKKHNGFFADLLSSIWDALKKALNI